MLVDSGVVDQSRDNNGPFDTSDQNQQQNPVSIDDLNSMESPTTFVWISNASTPNEKGPEEEEEDPFGQIVSAGDDALMDRENRNELGDNAEAHQLLVYLLLLKNIIIFTYLFLHLVLFRRMSRSFTH